MKIRNTKTQIIISNNSSKLEEALVGKRSGTIEAAFGNVRVSGSVFTWDHHGDMAGEICPCLQTEKQDVEIIGGSHFDLDFVGGCAAAMGIKPISGIGKINFQPFWDLAAFVDERGPHRLQEFLGFTHYLEDIYYAWCSWSQANRVFPPRDGSCLDITDKVLEAIDFLCACFSGDADSIAWGGEYRQQQTELERKSWIKINDTIGFIKFDYVAIRQADQAVNSLYAHDGKIYDAIIGHNTKTGSITLSFERPGLGNAVRIMQDYFGPKAGGHPGIAGSPRDKKYRIEDVPALAKKVEELLFLTSE